MTSTESEAVRLRSKARWNSRAFVSRSCRPNVARGALWGGTASPIGHLGSARTRSPHPAARGVGRPRHELIDQALRFVVGVLGGDDLQHGEEVPHRMIAAAPDPLPLQAQLLAGGGAGGDGHGLQAIE